MEEKTEWTAARAIATVFAAIVALVSITTITGTFVTDYIDPVMGAKILGVTATASAILPRVQWIKDLFK